MEFSRKVFGGKCNKGILWKENFWLSSSVYFNTKEAIHGKQDSMVLGIKARTLKCLLFSFTKKNETELKSKKNGFVKKCLLGECLVLYIFM